MPLYPAPRSPLPAPRSAARRHPRRFSPAATLLLTLLLGLGLALVSAVRAQTVYVGADDKATDTAQVGPPYYYRIVANADAPKYGVPGLPTGLSADKNTGLITGTPKGSGTVTLTLTLKASNATGMGTRELTLTVKPTTPVITSVNKVTAKVGQPFSYQIKATSSPTSYGVLGLFKGITVDPKTGLITGPPTAAGTHTLTLRATNTGGTGTKDLTVTVSN